ncbi:protein FAM240B [Anarhichas minor]|uniref:protein FAM240B n=1 Tax=Anarhichas minor TaxID=65739 RepID=UPI003F736E8A
MNVAKIHDGLHIKTFWEKKINRGSQHAESEEKRKNTSALKKLRDEWTIRLDNRTKHLKKLDDNVRKVQVESADQT